MADQPEALQLADALDVRVVPRWVHSTGQTPKQSGYKKDAECEQAAACLRRLYEENDALRDSNAAKADCIDRLGETVQRLHAENKSLRAAAEQVEAERVALLALIVDDGFAASFQTMAQYRSALLNSVKAKIQWLT